MCHHSHPVHTTHTWLIPQCTLTKMYPPVDYSNWQIADVQIFTYWLYLHNINWNSKRATCIVKLQDLAGKSKMTHCISEKQICCLLHSERSYLDLFLLRWWSVVGVSSMFTIVLLFYSASIFLKCIQFHHTQQRRRLILSTLYLLAVPRTSGLADVALHTLLLIIKYFKLTTEKRFQQILILFITTMI